MRTPISCLLPVRASNINSPSKQILNKLNFQTPLIVLINRLLYSQLGKRRIHTIIFDEAHEYLGGHKERNYHHMLEKLGKFEVQKVFITGTLPTSMETLFLEKVYLNHNPPSHIVIRSPTLRPELAHHVVEIPFTMPFKVTCVDITVKLANSLKQLLHPHERLIVFVQNVSDVEALSRRLGSSKYYSALGENEASVDINEKTLNHTRWTKGQSIIMVATPALIQGIDYPDVRFIIFHGGAYGLISYYQGAGRGGRGGARCDVFTVKDKRRNFKPREVLEDVQVEASAEWEEFQTTTQCLVSVITSCLDGSSLNCSKISGQQFCNNCNPEDAFHVLALTTINSCLPSHGQIPQNKCNKRAATSSLASSDDKHLWSQFPLSLMEEDIEKIKRAEQESRLDKPPPSSSFHLSPMKRPKLDQPPSSNTSFASSSFQPSPQYLNRTMASLPSSHASEPKEEQKYERNKPRLGQAASSSSSRQIPISSSSSSLYSSSSLLKSSLLKPSPFYSSSPSISGTPGGQRKIGESILRGASENSRSEEQRRKKSARLNDIMPMLLGFCPICFILKGQRVKSLPIGEKEGSGHRPLYDCGLGLQNKFPDYIDFRKEIILKGPYIYCYICGMPQSKNGNRLEPKCHSDVSCSREFWTVKGKKRSCPWKDIIHTTLFALYHDEIAMKDLLTHFMYTDKEDCREMTLDEWAKWLCTDLTDQGEYWKGLEVFLFKMAEHGLKGE